MALATALDNLGARLYRDLHVDTTDLAVTSRDPQVATTLISFSAYAEECLAVLDNPDVLAALEHARAQRSQ
jgi:hypothetical protein